MVVNEVVDGWGHAEITGSDQVPLLITSAGVASEEESTGEQADTLS